MPVVDFVALGELAKDLAVSECVRMIEVVEDDLFDAGVDEARNEVLQRYGALDDRWPETCINDVHRDLNTGQLSEDRQELPAFGVLLPGEVASADPARWSRSPQVLADLADGLVLDEHRGEKVSALALTLVDVGEAGHPD